MAFLHCRSLIVLALAIASIAQAASPSPTVVSHARRSVSIHDKVFQRRHNGNDGREGQFYGGNNPGNFNGDGHGQSKGEGKDENKNGPGRVTEQGRQGNNPSGKKDSNPPGKEHDQDGKDKGKKGVEEKPGHGTKAPGNEHSQGSKDKGKKDVDGKSGYGTKTQKNYVDDDDKHSNDKMPTPSQRPKPKNIQRRNFDSMSPSEIATAICPGSLSGCPVAEAGSLSSLPTTYNSWMQIGFECVDLNADLRACGGCPSLDIKHDCAAIPGAHDVACITGTCVVDSCIAGYTFNSTASTCTRN